MTERRYYSARTGRRVPAPADLPMLRRMFSNVYERLQAEGYLHEAFGYRKSDGTDVRGKAGSDIGAAMFQRLGKPDLFPIGQKCSSYSEDDLFDVVEFLYDWVSWSFVSPISRTLIHDKQVGRRKFRTEINAALRNYAGGYELSEEGEIRELGEEDMRPLLNGQPPEYDPENVDARVKAAVRKFTYHTPAVEDKREAVKQLAGVLEFLRRKLKGVLPSKDEGDIFNIANNFGIRHHNPAQKTQYDEGIWLDWIFYCYLNTIHVAVNLLARTEASP